MEQIRTWMREHNPGDQSKYLASCIAVLFLYLDFVLLMVGAEGSPRGIDAADGIVVMIAAWDMGRYCLNRYLNLTDQITFLGHVPASGVLRHHAFDAEAYFSEIKGKLHRPAVWVVICALLGAGMDFLDEDRAQNHVLHLTLILAVCICSVAMVYISYLTKKWQIKNELLYGTDHAGGFILKIFCSIFRVAEVLALAGGMASVILLWIFVRGVTEPAIDQSQIVFRVYADHYDYVYIMVSYGTLLACILNDSWKWLRKLLAAVCIASLLLGAAMIYQENHDYTEIRGEKLLDIHFHEKKEYNLSEVEQFQIYYEENSEGPQIRFTFSDGQSYLLFGDAVSMSNLYDEAYRNHYEFMLALTEKWLDAGAEGVLEEKDRSQLEQEEMDGRERKAWEKIKSKKNLCSKLR